MPETIIPIPIDDTFVENGRLNVEKSLKIRFNREQKSEAICVEAECRFQLERKLILKNDARNLFVQIERAKPDNSKDKTKCIITEKIHLKNEASESSYELISAITHIGEQVDRGHYVCYQKDGNEWYLCDDASISKADIKDLEASSMLVYRRI